MEAEVMQLFDSCWFRCEIFKKQPSSSSAEINPDHQNQEKTFKPQISRLTTLHGRSMSDQLGSKSSFNSGSVFPDSALLAPKLRNILSGKEATQENTEQIQIEVPSDKEITGGRRIKKGTATKSLSDLEFEELKGFMDLGFVFSKEDKESSLRSIIPGLQRLGNKDGDEERVDESAVKRPYLSEAWEVLDRRKKENPLMYWRVPALSDENDMKDNLRCWAHTVASTVR
ncbi:hypothetical protein L1049_010667 [Liquidambar formosana]|uniref:Uncharacterized protein n=1 Tax=Liquidambar formosana TaxID=63359 RepID=A0AAP0NBI3_LIQFO